MVSCDRAPPPQCSWFSGRERKQVEGVREGEEMKLLTKVDTEDGSGAGGEDLSCQAAEQHRHSAEQVQPITGH